MVRIEGYWTSNLLYEVLGIPIGTFFSPKKDLELSRLCGLLFFVLQSRTWDLILPIEGYWTSNFLYEVQGTAIGTFFSPKKNLKIAYGRLLDLNLSI